MTDATRPFADPLRTQLGALDCVVIDGRDVKEHGANLLVVLCHGYGAPPTDLVGLGAELISAAEGALSRARFVFPGAPDVADASAMGRAWWQIDLAALEAAMQSGKPRERRATVPEGMDKARRRVRSVVEAAQNQCGVPWSRTVLGGFSQGAMVTCDVAFRSDESPAALITFSGTLLAQDEWTAAAKRRSGMSVMQSHGRYDPLLSFTDAEALRDLMSDAGLDVNFVPFDGQHEIPMVALSAAKDLLLGVVGQG